MPLLRSDAVISARDSMLPGVLTNAPVFGKGFGPCVTTSVIEVYTAATVAYLFGLDTHVHQAFTELPVLATVLHAFVKTICCDDMLLPGG